MTNASRTDEIEEKVMYSILQKRPKRADLYWFVHVNILSEPYKTEYKVTEIIKDDLFRIDFNLGFREPTKINLMFKEVLKDMVKNGEVDVTSRYESLNKNNILGDFKFVLLEKFLSNKFAKSTIQSESICKYCETHIPKSVKQHMRHCLAKKAYDLQHHTGNELDDDVNDLDDDVNNDNNIFNTGKIRYIGDITGKLNKRTRDNKRVFYCLKQ